MGHILKSLFNSRADIQWNLSDEQSQQKGLRGSKLTQIFWFRGVKINLGSNVADYIVD